MEPIKTFWCPIYSNVKTTKRHEVFFWNRFSTTAGHVCRPSELPPGAMYDAFWMPSEKLIIPGTNVRLVIRMPNNHDFTPAAYANNCDRKGEDHDCWCVHWETHTDHIHIDKTPIEGRTTCSAGGGSIAYGPGHYFIHDGYIIDA